MYLFQFLFCFRWHFFLQLFVLTFVQFHSLSPIYRRTYSYSVNHSFLHLANVCGIGSFFPEKSVKYCNYWIIPSLYTFRVYFCILIFSVCVRDNRSHAAGCGVSRISDEVATKSVFSAGATMADTAWLGAVQLDEPIDRRPAKRLLSQSVQRCRWSHDLWRITAQWTGLW